ncbi:membrane fusion protein, epimerase transport system [Modicisalibacter ilicicola DSM 19980]|uniref:Membrane fusion protein (MFP) family protein n=1 Tax=Modicisalibacter ilicicola DSM 19980 TaxID=1121942 RepID=A0A1M4X0I6_9GAMM|nr:HlyD family type I secretion periplasmic adaptor subunit [Halomonas ilicicola]SHE86702.1 membrane fusion protein, epimerase transport system [Halomonas ilicicola DSM 19980]
MTKHSAEGGADFIPGETTTRHAARDNDATLPVKDTAYRRLGLMILLVAFGGFGGWALSANLAVAVVAPGSVSVESSKKTVQHLEGGIVKEILVEDGDRVDAGAALLVLDDTQSRSQLQIAESEYHIARASEIRLLAEQAGDQILDFPEKLLDSPSPRVQAVLNVQRRLFEARHESLRGTLAALDEQVVQMQEQIAGLEAIQAVNRSRIRSLANEADDYRALFKEGLGNNQRLRELERQVMQYKGENAQHSAEIARLKSQVSENRLQKEIRTQEFQQDIGERLREVQATIADSEERITALSDQVRRTRVLAPVSGTVVGMQIHTLGAVIRSGDPLLDIVPAGDGFIVEARVADRDIDNVYVGQRAEIRFSAFNQRLSNVIDGEIVHVSADSFEDEATRVRYYKAKVKVSEQGRGDMTESMQLLAGMPAEVMIRTGERTFASYIAKPFTDMLARAMREE